MNFRHFLLSCILIWRSGDFLDTFGPSRSVCAVQWLKTENKITKSVWSSFFGLRSRDKYQHTHFRLHFCISSLWQSGKVCLSFRSKIKTGRWSLISSFFENSNCVKSRKQTFGKKFVITSIFSFSEKDLNFLV